MDQPAPTSDLRRRLARLHAAARARLSVLAVVGVAAYAGGVIARWSYILLAHHPRHHVASDAMPITALAQVLADPAGRQQFFHTIWPPGASAFYALTTLHDATLGSAAVWHFVLASAVPLFVAHAALLAYGVRAGWIALAMGALHFGFIHYGGFFLAEQLFQAATAAALWATVAALSAEGRRWRLVGGVASGAAWTLAFAFRPNALPIALFAAVCLAVRWWRQGRRTHLLGLAAGAVTLLVLAAPLAHRCTSLLGRFCPGSSNFAMNVALGHAPPGVAGLHFKPQSAEHATGPNHWWPPARLHHGYRELAEVPASLYDTGAVLAWVKDRFVESPARFALDSLGNALDLFGMPYWPDGYGNLQARRATILKQLFFVLVLVPGLGMFGLQIVRLAQRRKPDDVTFFLLAVLGGLFLLAAASMGEARYRIPFDGVFIIFAARAFALVTARGAPGATDAAAAAGSRQAIQSGALITAAVALPVAAALLVATAHPGMRLAARLSSLLGLRRAPPRVAASFPLSAFSPRPDGSAWNAPQNFVFDCRRTCPELRIDLPGVRHAARVEASSDHNDRYELVFYRSGALVGRTAWGAFEVGDGLKVVTVDVPPATRAAGFDTLGVRPLYGDHRYSLGHVALRDE